MTTELQSQQNPLVDVPFFPDYNRIRPHHVVPAVDELLARAEQAFHEAFEKPERVLPTWEDTMARGSDRVPPPLLVSPWEDRANLWLAQWRA
jgi:Zn-dependent oligopeptidase